MESDNLGSHSVKEQSANHLGPLAVLGRVVRAVADVRGTFVVSIAQSLPFYLSHWLPFSGSLFQHRGLWRSRKPEPSLAIFGYFSFDVSVNSF